jgi:hypothetical protein
VLWLSTSDPADILFDAPYVQRLFLSSLLQGSVVDAVARRYPDLVRVIYSGPLGSESRLSVALAELGMEVTIAALRESGRRLDRATFVETLRTSRALTPPGQATVSFADPSRGGITGTLVAQRGADGLTPGSLWASPPACRLAL